MVDYLVTIAFYLSWLVHKGRGQIRQGVGRRRNFKVAKGLVKPDDFLIFKAQVSGIVLNVLGRNKVGKDKLRLHP